VTQTDSFSEELVSVFESFTNYLCNVVVKDTQTALKHIKKNGAQLVLIELSTDAEKNKLLFQTISESITYLNPFPYFIAFSNDNAFALNAITSGFSDYVTNELSVHELGKTLFKFERRTPEKIAANICIKSYSDYQFVSLDDIVYLKADNNTTDIQHINGKVVNAYKTLKHFEQTLPFYFLRIHKSYIVNINHVSRIHFSKSKCYINYNQIMDHIIFMGIS
jgi:DNA-binding LytR/AlgR family response regulator